ncbi:glycosyl hydrolase family 32 [Yersinia pseudotuberculosis]|uniref:Sucrose-6-phosphate hydrolase n=1 Tax=Yersinia pseudotuberculosis TaxID=633 RepID=A0A380Q560_YERPU|nr:glycoside hydrolase family 32 protein [Yersinia pseudotuberculosis]PSH23929.1 glycosyl hydrolase family 32 [Yersinia pseudotuberculosis]SUP80926.1 Sucrose-6-phosphate hydrolase [Yersinia pseudotuberculosis]
MTLLIEKAEKELNTRQNALNQRWYPRFHLAARAGWMNDPNGLTWFDGWYHAFYQHHPYSTAWGPMHWGHARSRDLVHWEHLPVALAPEGPEDKDGCFSGSAVVNGDELALIYTGHKYHGDPTNDDNLYQVQCLATSTDGIHFTRQGLVLDTPEGLHHFRDPKVWREADRWYMVVGARTGDTGQIRLFHSPDLRHWEAEGILAEAPDDMGFMWECPDFFTLGNKQVLIISPQGIAAKGYANRNLYQSGYIVGRWQPDQLFTQETQFQELDHGHDFYAPQSFLTPDGRRIVIGWMDMWESPMPEQLDGWAGMLSLPRELTLSADNRLLISPAAEVLNLRQAWSNWSITSLNNQQITVVTHCETQEVILHWDLSRTTAEQYGIALGDGLRLYVDSQHQRLILERYYPEYGLCGQRSVPLNVASELKLRVFFDCSSVEVFVQDGEACLSSRIYPQQRQLTLFAWSGVATLIEGGAWELE